MKNTMRTSLFVVVPVVAVLAAVLLMTRERPNRRPGTDAPPAAAGENERSAKETPLPDEPSSFGWPGGGVPDRQFRDARNIIKADPAIPDRDKDELIENLVQSFYPGEEAPAETPEEQEEQRAMNRLILDFRSRAEKIKNDGRVTRDEKIEKLNGLIMEFLQKLSEQQPDEPAE